MTDIPDYGIDAPGVVKAQGYIGIALLIIAAIAIKLDLPPLAGPTLWTGAWLCLAAIAMIVTSRVTKPIVIRHMLDRLHLLGDETLLDVGCGRGLLAIEAAKRLPDGRVSGLDLWSQKDQSGNAPEATTRNVTLAGVGNRVQLDTADMRKMPYPDAHFDVVISSQAIHNIPDAAGRAQAIGEIVRVLKPGGRFAILDFRNTAHYRHELEAAGMATERSGMNFLMFPPVRIVTGRKPG